MKKRFKLKEGSPLEMLRQFAVDLGADLLEDFGASQLVLDNKYGKGRIGLFEVFPGLTAWVYNIKFYEGYKFEHLFSDDGIFYFGYHVSGYQLTKFGDEDEFKKIGERQNFILSGNKGMQANFEIPASINYKCCYLIIQPSLLDDKNTKTKEQLKKHLAEIIGNSKNNKPLRYFGDVDFRTGVYSEIIVRNERTDLVGRLLTESAILSMLASQIDAHHKDIEEVELQPKLTKDELFKISKLGDYLVKNIANKISIDKIARKLGMNPKKLQSGVRFLYGHTVNEYFKNIRLEHARELFNTTDMNVSEICYSVGYSSRSYFAKQFKNRYGLYPNEYRLSVTSDGLLYEISYRSMAEENISPKELDNILEFSKERNGKHNITGCLIFHRNVFFQLIEGPRKEILALYDSIKFDKRHFDVQTIWKGVKPNREFEKWAMAMLSDKDRMNMAHEGDTTNLSLGHLMGDIDRQSLESKHLWRKVRNKLKVS